MTDQSSGDPTSASDIAAQVRAGDVARRRRARTAPGRDRRRRRGDPRVQRRHRRPRPRAGGGGRRGRRGRSRDGTPRRRADRAEGQHVHAGDPDHLLVEDPRRVEAAVRRDHRRPAARRRRRADREDEPRRVRNGFEHGELGVRPDAQPTRHHTGARWVERRVGGRGRRRLRAGLAGVRHRRLDPSASVAVWRGRCEAHLWRGQPLRARCVRIEPRPDRPVRQHGRRRGARARSDLRARPDGFHVDRPGRPRRVERPRPRGRGPAGRTDHRPAGRSERRCVGPPRRCLRRARQGRRRDRRRDGAGLCLRPHGVLPDRAGGGVEQPGPLRRRAVRAAGRGLRHERDVHGHAHGGVRRRGEAAHHARHVRPLGGLLRRLLRAGPQGAPPDRRRLRRGVRTRRRAAHADIADRRLPAR